MCQPPTSLPQIGYFLDTCSTIISTRNKNHVQNIHPCDSGEERRAYKNGGHQDYVHTRTLKCYPLDFFMGSPSQKYSPFPQWRPSSVFLLRHNWTHRSTYNLRMAPVSCPSNAEEANNNMTRPMSPLTKAKLRTTTF